MMREIEQLKPFIRDVFEVNGWVAATTGMYHPGGDGVTLGFKAAGDRIKVSDLCSATRALRQNNAKPPAENGDFSASLEREGVTYVAGEVFTYASSDMDLLSAAKRVAQSSLVISAKTRYSRGPFSANFVEQVGIILQKFIGDAGKIQRNWVDTGRDETGAFPVDYRVNGCVREQHLHVVGSDGKADRAALSAFFHRQKRVGLRTIMIIAPGWHPGPTPYARISSASDQVIHELDRDPDRLVAALMMT